MQDYVVLGELHCNIYKETFMLFFSLSEVKVTLLNSDVTPNSPFYIAKPLNRSEAKGDLVIIQT